MKYPSKTDITVLPADPERGKTLNFSVREYHGSEVYPYHGDESQGDLTPITTESDLVIGMQILVPSLFGGFHVMTVTGSPDDRYAETENLMALLEFAKDDRSSWVATCLINKKGLERLKIG